MISFKLFAGTDVGLRDNNEDNFTVSPDLMQNEWMMPADHQQVIPLGERGCLMVVADGMGGQNAGEVASAIAIETVQSMLAPENLSDKVLAKSSTIKDYLKKVVSKADSNVKKYSKEHPEAEGLGSTIVMAWVIGNKAYIAWLGDSRAYALVSGQGIKRLSKDHSYVQQLVDEGKLTDIEAMNHPNSNIITRSLGDTSQKAKADVEEYSLQDGEIILLCSDGLCGVCTDDEIAGVLTEEANDLQVCKEQLTELALDNGGSDNITIALMQISCNEEEKGEEGKTKHRKSSRAFLYTFLILIGISAIGFLGWWMNGKTVVSCPKAANEVEMTRKSNGDPTKGTVKSQKETKNKGTRQDKKTASKKAGIKARLDSLERARQHHKTDSEANKITSSPGAGSGSSRPL